MQPHHSGMIDMQASAPAITQANGNPENHHRDMDVLVLAAGGRNGEVLCDTLQKAGVKSRLCPNIEALVSAVKEGAGVVLLTAQMLTEYTSLQLRVMLNQQPPWSDLPLIILVAKDQIGLVAGLDLRAQVTLLEQPVRSYVLVSAMQSALRARRRQYELRDLYLDLEARVQARTEQVQNLVTQLTLTEQAERQRISHILHDDLQQRLYSMNFQLAMLRAAMEDEDQAGARAILGETEEVVRDAIEVTRNLSVNLSPPILQSEGFVEALYWLASQMEQQHGLAVTVRAVEEWPALDVSLREMLFQVVRELLFNVVKHAGVNMATVTLTYEDGQLCIEVRDQGQGFEPEQQDSVRGQGLLRNVQRLQLIGGRMQIDSRPEQGTSITLLVPFGN
jgi:signal transduction histidine kinase